MKILILSLALALCGCATLDDKQKPDAQIIVKYKYVITQVPAEMLTIPAPMYKIDPKTATDKDAAQWIVDSEKRFSEIEKKLQAVKDYLDKKLKELNVPENDLVIN